MATPDAPPPDLLTAMTNLITVLKQDLNQRLDQQSKDLDQRLDQQSKQLSKEQSKQSQQSKQLSKQLSEQSQQSKEQSKQMASLSNSQGYLVEEQARCGTTAWLCLID